MPEPQKTLKRSRDEDDQPEKPPKRYKECTYDDKTGLPSEPPDAPSTPVGTHAQSLPQTPDASGNRSACGNSSNPRSSASLSTSDTTSNTAAASDSSRSRDGTSFTDSSPLTSYETSVGLTKQILSGSTLQSTIKSLRQSSLAKTGPAPPPVAARPTSRMSFMRKYLVLESKNTLPAMRGLYEQTQVFSTHVHHVLGLGEELRPKLASIAGPALRDLYNKVLRTQDNDTLDSYMARIVSSIEVNSVTFFTALVGAFITTAILDYDVPWESNEDFMEYTKKWTRDKNIFILYEMEKHLNLHWLDVPKYLASKRQTDESFQREVSRHAHKKTAAFIDVIAQHINTMLSEAPRRNRNLLIHDWESEFYDDIHALMVAAYNTRIQLDIDLDQHTVVWPSAESEFDDESMNKNFLTDSRFDRPTSKLGQPPQHGQTIAYATFPALQRKSINGVPNKTEKVRVRARVICKQQKKPGNRARSHKEDLEALKESLRGRRAKSV